MNGKAFDEKIDADWKEYRDEYGIARAFTPHQMTLVEIVFKFGFTQGAGCVLQADELFPTGGPVITQAEMMAATRGE